MYDKPIIAVKPKKKYIHVNMHKIRANKKHGTNEAVITVKEGRKNKQSLLSKRAERTHMVTK
jgi:hypothetical protein